MMQSDKEKFDVSNLDSEPRAVNTGICAEKRKVSYEDLWGGTAKGASTGYRMKSC